MDKILLIFTCLYVNIADLNEWSEERVDHLRQQIRVRI